jgi:hypothetical protein
MTGQTAATQGHDKVAGRQRGATVRRDGRAAGGAAPFAETLRLHRAIGNAAFDAVAHPGPDELPSSVVSVLRTEGQPLEPSVRAFMEERFGRDFGHVRVHTDPAAAESAVDVAATAYTVGRHMVFTPEKYVPDTVDGRRSLAHELAHVVQQSRGGPARGFAADHPLERAADDAAVQVAAGGGTVVDVVGGSTATLARQGDEQEIARRPNSNPALAKALALQGILSGEAEVAAMERSGSPEPIPGPPGSQDAYIEMATHLRKSLAAKGVKLPASFVPNAEWDAKKKLAAQRATKERSDAKASRVAVQVGRGFGAAGDERRDAVSGALVFKVQAMLEKEGLTPEQIEDLRSSIRRGGGQSVGAAFLRGDPDAAGVLDDFGSVGMRPWRSFIPPAADEERRIRRVLKLGPTQYISQAHLDDLGRRLANEEGLVVKGSSLGPEDKVMLSRFFGRTDHLRASDNVDPLIAAEGFTGKLSDYEAMIFRWRLEQLATSASTAVGYAGASLFTADEEIRWEVAGFAGLLGAIGDVAATTGQQRSHFKSISAPPVRKEDITLHAPPGARPPEPSGPTPMSRPGGGGRTPVSSTPVATLPLGPVDLPGEVANINAPRPATKVRPIWSAPKWDVVGQLQLDRTAPRKMAAGDFEHSAGVSRDPISNSAGGRRPPRWTPDTVARPQQPSATSPAPRAPAAGTGAPPNKRAITEIIAETRRLTSDIRKTLARMGVAEAPGGLPVASTPGQRGPAPGSEGKASPRVERGQPPTGKPPGPGQIDDAAPTGPGPRAVGPIGKWRQERKFLLTLPPEAREARFRAWRDIAGVGPSWKATDVKSATPGVTMYAGTGDRVLVFYGGGKMAEGDLNQPEQFARMPDGSVRLVDVERLKKYEPEPSK